MNEESKKANEALTRGEGVDLADLVPREVDRDGWPKGPWDDEPDKVEWRSNGYACLIVRGPATGALCGYIGLKPGHPWYGKHYDEIEAEVHGGLTYSNTGCAGHICHVPEPGEDDVVHWIGFDCAHFQDISPQMEATRMKFMPDAPERPGGMFGFCTYKDVAYVRAEVENLREQAEEVAREENANPFPKWPSDGE